jgi:hypothetical protein
MFYNAPDRAGGLFILEPRSVDCFDVHNFIYLSALNYLIGYRYEIIVIVGIQTIFFLSRLSFTHISCRHCHH